MLNTNLLIALIIVALGYFSVAAQQPSAEMTAANALFSAERWTEATAAYEEILKREPDNSNAWYQLGMTRYSLKQFKPAAAAFEKSVAISNSAFAMYNLACIYSLMNERDAALEWLGKTIDNPKAILATINFDDPDLTNIKTDARFKKLAEDVDRKIHPCKFIPEARQFDFFIGEWTAYSPQGFKTGTSIIQGIADGCGILENWTNAAGGGGGKSINFYDRAAGKWYEYWIGGNGVPLRYSGVYKDNAIRFEGEPLTTNGKTIQLRLTFFNIDADTVRQLAENSSDDGKTWTILYDFKYVRKK